MSIIPRHRQMPPCVIKPVFASLKLECRRYMVTTSQKMDRSRRTRHPRQEIKLINTHIKFIPTNCQLYISQFSILTIRLIHKDLSHSYGSNVSHMVFKRVALSIKQVPGGVRSWRTWKYWPRQGVFLRFYTRCGHNRFVNLNSQNA